MKRTVQFLVLIVLTAVAIGAYAGTPDDELFVIAAGHGPGAEGSFWVTDLYVMNPGEDPITITVTFLERGMDNSDAEGQQFDLEGGELLVIEDVVAELSEAETIFGALQVEIFEEEEEEEAARGGFLAEAEEDEGFEDFEEHDVILVQARVYDRSGEGTRGQSLDGVASASAIAADGSRPMTHAIGVAETSEFRSSWFGLNITTDEADEPGSARVLVEVLDESGDVVGEDTFTLPPRSPIHHAVSELAPGFANGTVRFTMMEGEAIFAASRLDNISNDGLTLVTWTDSIDPMDREFTDDFATDQCTFIPTGTNPFFPLTPGLRIVLQGEEDGELVEAIVEVQPNTRVVDGVTTRVVTETESVDGELVEVSFNYFAECMETRTVFYFGEDVDDYEDGELVGHEGEWLAGQNGAEAGIFMPGMPVAGSRYFQEVAPGVALDRAEHLATGRTVETEVGTFEDCLVVRDTNALELSDTGDVKVYCRGIGIVHDGDLDIVELTLP